MFTKLKVNAFEKALIYKDGALEKVLGQGTYWLWKRTFTLHQMTREFKPLLEISLIVDHPDLSPLLEVVEVKDTEIVIQYKDGNFYRTLTSGTYAFWKEVINYTYKVVDLDQVYITQGVSKKLLTTVLRPYVIVHELASYEKGILYIDGSYVKVLDPGVYYFWNGTKTVQVSKTDMRKQQLDISGQELLTKDKAAVRINFYANYRVVDILKSIDDTKDALKQLYVLMQLSLREYVGKYSLDELLVSKDSIGKFVLDASTAKASNLGIKVLNGGIRDIILPGDVREIMNQVLIAEKRAQANVIMRREETASTRSLLNTAKLMEQNDMLFKLKEMEYVEKIAEKIQNISLSGGSDLIGQLKGILGTKK